MKMSFHWSAAQRRGTPFFCRVDLQLVSCLPDAKAPFLLRGLRDGPSLEFFRNLSL